jgi:hypothetical protein
MKYYYYVAFLRENANMGWRIRETKNDMDTLEGFQKELSDMNKEDNGSLMILSFKKFKVQEKSFWRKLYEKILPRLHN